jgi:hypothetical protein
MTQSGERVTEAPRRAPGVDEKLKIEKLAHRFQTQLSAFCIPFAFCILCPTPFKRVLYMERFHMGLHIDQYGKAQFDMGRPIRNLF